LLFLLFPQNHYIVSVKLGLSNVVQVSEPSFESLEHFKIYFYEYSSFSDLDTSDFDALEILVQGEPLYRTIPLIPGMFTLPNDETELILNFGFRIW